MVAKSKNINWKKNNLKMPSVNLNVTHFVQALS